jgi:hypothetical protein
MPIPTQALGFILNHPHLFLPGLGPKAKIIDKIPQEMVRKWIVGQDSVNL